MELTCWLRRSNNCRARPRWVLEWRKNVFDPFLTGTDGYMANNSCDQHLEELLALIGRNWDGKIKLMSVAFYENAHVKGLEAWSGQGLGKS